MNKTAVAGMTVIVALGVMIFLQGQDNVTNQQVDLSYTGTESNGVDVSKAQGQVSNSSKETMRTLIIQNEGLENNVTQLKKDLDTLQRQLKKTNNSSTQEGQQDSGVAELVAELKAELEDLRKAVEKKTTKPDSNSSSSQTRTTKDQYTPESKPTTITKVEDNDLFNDLVPQLTNPSFSLRQPTKDTASEKVKNTAGILSRLPSSTNTDGDLVWFDQVDLTVTKSEKGEESRAYPTQLAMSSNSKIQGASFDLDSGINTNEQNGNKSSSKSNAKASTKSSGGQERVTAIPMYTIPSQSSLLGAVSTTALIGRVPSNGTLSNPYRFKVMLGEKNLATNGHYIPNLKSMVLGGIAQGDFTMECVSGVIDKATFTFDDGTIREIRAESSNTSGSLSQSDGLGWISDAAGVGCIEGEYISNATEYLTTIGALSSISTLASAVADAQTTIYSDSDSSSTSVTGDTLTYALGEGVSDGVDEMSDWFTERQESAFDAVFLPVGQNLIVHIEQKLEIDYEPDGRKLSYAKKSEVEDYLQW
jgi:integrating conjugative element protein (TIGR03752 family)